MRNPPSNTDNVIDSRDVIERIEELGSEREALVADITAAEEDLADASDDTSVLKEDAEELSELGKKVDEAKVLLEEWDADNGEELAALRSLQDECEGYSDWRHGETLIRDGYFEEYAQDLAEDLGMDKDQPWPYSCIDWKKAAEELQQDYSLITFDGEDYWIRG